MKHIIYITSLVILLQGCMVGPKFHKSDWTKESKYKYSNSISDTDSIATIKWREVYKDTVLQSLIRTALTENKDLQIAASRILESQYAIGYNRADMLPKFDYSATGSVLNKSNSEASGAGTLYRNNVRGFGMVSWELDFWGRYRHATRAAKELMLASEDARNLLVTSIVAQVATLYFQLRSLDQQLEIAKQTLEVRKASTQLITSRFEGGEVPELDKYQAQTQEAITAALVPNLERQIAKTENALGILLGRNPGPVDRGLANVSQSLPLYIPAGLPSQLLEHRWDVKQAEELWRAQTDQVGIAQAVRFPSFSLTGLFGAASQDLTNITESGSLISYATGSITGPVFYFQKNKRRVDMEREKMEQARLQYEKVVINAFAEVEDALISVDTYRREYEARNMQLTASHGAAMLSRERYDAGYTNYLEVLDNERTELDAALAAAQALQYHLQSTVQLYKTLGGGWE
jgi:multidrug efflux system outer membrane protein